MPTYTNNASATRAVVNTDGDTVMVANGESVETYHLLTAAGWSKTADTPYYNPVLAVHDTLSGSSDIQIKLQSGTDSIEVYNNSSAVVTVLLTSTGNTPGYAVPSETTRVIDTLGGYVDEIILQFSASVSSGEVIVTELD